MYTIYARGKLTMDQCRIADREIKSGMIEYVDYNLVCFHSLEKSDIKSARELMERFGFTVEPEIFEEHYYGGHVEEHRSEKVEEELR